MSRPVTAGTGVNGLKDVKVTDCTMNVRLNVIQIMNFFVLSCVHVFVSTVCVSEENYKKAVCNLLPKLKTPDSEL